MPELADTRIAIRQRTRIVALLLKGLVGLAFGIFVLVAQDVFYEFHFLLIGAALIATGALSFLALTASQHGEGYRLMDLVEGCLGLLLGSISLGAAFVEMARPDFLIISFTLTLLMCGIIEVCLSSSIGKRVGLTMGLFTGAAFSGMSMLALAGSAGESDVFAVVGALLLLMSGVVALLGASRAAA